MTNLKSVTPGGILKDLNDNFGYIAPLNSSYGIGNLRVVRCLFDTSANDNDGVSNKTIAAHKVSVAIPAYALIVGGFLDVNTAVTSTNSTATIAVHVVAANDVVSAAQVNGAPWSTIGRKAIVPKANTPESTSLKATTESYVTFTVAVEALTAGKVTCYLYLLEGIASA